MIRKKSSLVRAIIISLFILSIFQGFKSFAANNEALSTNISTISPVTPNSPLSEEQLKRRKNSRVALAKRLSNFVNSDYYWKKARVGIYVETVKERNKVYSKNASLPLIPASNLKVVTTASALSMMGSDYRFETSLWGNPVDESGIMHSNLYLKGTGDPTFMYPFTNQPSEILHKFAKVLKKRGVKVIQGDIIGDDSAFDREFQGRGWKKRYILEDYAGPVSALSINGNIVQLSIKGRQVKMNPGNGYIKVRRKYKGRYLYVTRKLGTDIVTVYGPSSRYAKRGITVNNPSRFTTGVFAKILKIHGIKILGKPRLIKPDEDYKETERYHKIAFHRSVPLSEIAKETNKESDNICAFHLLKGLGYKIKGKGTIDNCNKIVKEWLKKAEIDSKGLALADGSGLSVYNRVTPKLMTGILVYMTKDPQWEYFWESLPIAGIDGTLKYRLKNYPVRAKTGTIKGHVALSGYVKTKAGQLLAFSIITNRHGTSSSRIRANEDYFVKMLARWNRKL